MKQSIQVTMFVLLLVNGCGTGATVVADRIKDDPSVGIPEGWE